jgi:hypothetical protein
MEHLIQEVVVAEMGSLVAQVAQVVRVFSSFHIKKSRKSYSPFEMDVMIKKSSYAIPYPLIPSGAR